MQNPYKRCIANENCVFSSETVKKKMKKEKKDHTGHMFGSLTYTVRLYPARNNSVLRLFFFSSIYWQTNFKDVYRHVQLVYRC